MKNPVKLLIAVFWIIAIGLVIAFFFSDGSPQVIEEPRSKLPSSASRDSPESGMMESGEEDGFSSRTIGEPKTNGPREDDIAIPVDGNPLLVTLAFYPELGQIWIEQYDKEGKPTGKPLKSGTAVQIPNPNIAGEKIHFIVP